MSERLTPLSCSKIEKKLLKLGFKHDRTDDAIRFYSRIVGGKYFLVQVHFHPGDKGIEVVRSILRTGGIDRSDWIKA